MKSKTIKLYMPFILVLLFVGIGINSVSAQNGNRQFISEQLKEKKVAYLSNKMSLTVEEGQIFWPIYNEREAKLGKLKDELKKNFKTARKGQNDGLSDSQMQEIMDNTFDLREQIGDVEKEYYLKFKKALPIAKVFSFYKAENDFKKELMRTIRGERGERNHPSRSNQ